VAKVSVIMPAFNSMRHISEAIESVLSQSFSDFELLVIDGGSTDGSVEIINKFVENDNRVIFLNNIDDQGPAHARSVGIRHSTGKYVAFIDADDAWLSNKLSMQINFMEDISIDFCYTSYRSMDESGVKLSCIVPMYSSYNFYQALARRGIGTLTVMVRRGLLTESVLNEFGKSHGEEYLWWLLILKQGGVAKHLDEDTARYRDAEGSLSTHRYRHQLTVWNSYRNEIGLGIVMAIVFYSSYMIDAASRKMWVAVCSRFIKSRL